MITAARPLPAAATRSRLYREQLIALLRREIDLHNQAANHRALGRQYPRLRAFCLATVTRLTEVLDLAGADWAANEERIRPYELEEDGA